MKYFIWEVIQGFIFRIYTNFNERSVISSIIFEGQCHLVKP